jgi:hypothetical protein
VPPAGPWGSTTPPTTGGRARPTGSAWTSSGPGSSGGPGCPTPPRSSWSRRSWPSPWATRGSDRPGSPPSWPGRSGAGSGSPPTGCGGSSAATARAKRLGLVAGYAAPPRPEGPARISQPERHLDVERPGQLVQTDCFCIGRLSGTKGTVWQYTAIDVGSAWCWAELHVTPRNPPARWTSHLARTVARDLARWGWRLEAVMSDNASEFRSQEFQAAAARLGARHMFIRGQTPDQRGGGTGPGDHPGGVLEAGLRPVPNPQTDWAPAGPGALPSLLRMKVKSL